MSTASLSIIRETRGYWEKGRYISRGVTGHWSKWGGAKRTVYINQYERVEEQWMCQSCGNKMPLEISAYLYEFPEDEYIRVCAPCLTDDCAMLKARIG